MRLSEYLLKEVADAGAFMDAPQGNNTTPHGQVKFRDYLQQEHKPEYRIYIDMDGVLCDFEKGIHDIDGKTNAQELFKQPENALWEHIAKKGLFEFFSELEWHPEGKKLWEYIKDKPRIQILSSLGRTNPDKEATRRAKLKWLKEHGITIPSNFSQKASDKQAWADSKAILIDDYDKNIKDWNEKGGIAIQFKTADEAIKKLEELDIKEWYTRTMSKEVIE